MSWHEQTVSIPYRIWQDAAISVMDVYIRDACVLKLKRVDQGVHGPSYWTPCDGDDEVNATNLPAGTVLCNPGKYIPGIVCAYLLDTAYRELTSED
jgi:hypothetical protein